MINNLHLICINFELRIVIDIELYISKEKKSIKFQLIKI